MGLDKMSIEEQGELEQKVWIKGKKNVSFEWVVHMPAEDSRVQVDFLGDGEMESQMSVSLLWKISCQITC